MKILHELRLIPGLTLRKDLAGILVALMAFLLFPYLIRGLDPTAASIDPGMLSGILLAIAAVLIFKAVSWWLIKVIWPVLALYATVRLSLHFESLTPLQKVLISLGAYLLILYAFLFSLAFLT